MRTSKPARRHRSLRIALATALVGSFAVASAAPASAATKPKVNTDVSLDTTTPATGQLFTVTIGYACSSATVDCTNALLTMTLPAGLDNPTNWATTKHIVPPPTFNSGTRVITFTFKPTLKAGASGQVSFTTAFTQGPTPDGMTVSFQSTMTATGANPATSKAVSATAQVNNPWATQKTVSTAGPVNGNSSYVVKACHGPATTGAINLTDYVLTDTIPANSVFVSASGNGTYNAATRKVTWTSTGVTPSSAGCTTAYTLTLLYPSPPFKAGDPVTNTAQGTGDVPDIGGKQKPVGLAPASANHFLAPVNPNISIAKSAGQTTIVTGQSMTWTVTVRNIGNVPVAPSWVDYFPEGFYILANNPIALGNTQGLRVNISYSVATNPRSPGSFTPIAGGPFIGNGSNSVSAPKSLPGNAYGITALRYDFVDPIQPGVTTTFVNTLYFTGQWDNGGTMANNTKLFNCVTANWVYSGQPGTSGSVCASVNTALPNTAIAVSKVPNSTYLVPGKTTTWTLTVKSDSASGANVPESWVVTDILPQGLYIPPSGSVAIGNTLGGTVDIDYSVDTNPRTSPTWVNLGTFSGNGAGSATTAPAQLKGNAPYITGLRWKFNSPMAIGAQWQAQLLPYFSTTDDSSNTISNGSIIKNCITAKSTFGATTTSVQGCGQMTVTPVIEIQASNSGGANICCYSIYNTGTQVNFPINVTSTANSWYNVTDPVVTDVVPPQMLPWNNGDWAKSYTVTGSAGLTLQGFTQTAMSGGRTALKWSFTGAFKPSTAITITLRTQAGFDLPYVNYDDHLWMGGTMQISPTCSYSASAGGLGRQADAENVLGNGSSYQGCHSKYGYQIAPYAAIDSFASVRGQNDASYVSYPAAGQSVPGGLADYQLQMTNSGNVNLTNMVFVDVLPYVGDTEVLSNTPRNSDYRPNLAGPVSAPNGVTIYYATVTNPCEPAIGVTTGCVSSAWSTSPPADITMVAAVKVVFGSTVLQPGQTQTFGWPMRVPNGTPPNKVAWDSFAYTAKRMDTNATLLPSEPHEIGINVNAPTAGTNTIGDRVFLDLNNNGLQDDGNFGVNGMIVRLYTSTGTFVAQTVSGYDYNGNAGYFSFPSLADGTYYMVFDLTTMPYNSQTVPFEVGYPANQLIDSDGNQTTGHTPNITVAGGVVDNSWDEGIFVCSIDIGCG